MQVGKEEKIHVPPHCLLFPSCIFSMIFRNLVSFFFFTEENPAFIKQNVSLITDCWGTQLEKGVLRFSNNVRRS